MILSALQAAFTNLVVFSILPVLWWFFRHRRETTFWHWIGLYQPRLQSKWWLLLLFALLYYFFYSFDFTQLFSATTLESLESSDSISANAFAGIGAAAILPALIQTFIGNGLAEEIFFRGFLCKRLCAHFGSTGGILLQTGLFGIMHNVLYLIAGIPIDLGAHLIIFFFTAIGALLLATLNEKLYNGSILPSVLLHGLGNFISTMLIAF